MRIMQYIPQKSNGLKFYDKEEYCINSDFNM